jgi:hypothetical protein
MDHLFSEDLANACAGANTFKDALSSLIIGHADVLIVRGPSGTGKSVFAGALVQRFTKANSLSYSALGDEAFFKRDYFAIKSGYQSLLGARSFAKDISVPIMDLLSLASPYIEKGVKTVAAIVQGEMKRRKKEALVLSEEEINFLTDLQLESRGRQVVFKADDFQWWDPASIRLLKLIVSGRLQNTFSFVNRTKVILIHNSDHHLADEADLFYRWLRANRKCRIVEFKYLDGTNFDRHRTQLGLPKTIDPQQMKLFFQLCGGHLNMLSQACEQAKQFEELKAVNVDSSREAIFDQIIALKIDSWGESREKVLTFLRSSALIGLLFSRDEVRCLLGKESHESIQNIIDFCIEKKLIKVDGDGYRFAHDEIRRQFKKMPFNIEMSLRQAYGQCLRILLPAQYRLRADNYLIAGDKALGAQFLTLWACARIRSGVSVSEIIESEDELKTEDVQLFEMLHLYGKAFSYLQSGKVREADAISRKFVGFDSTYFKIELEILRSAILIELREERRRKEAIDILEQLLPSAIDEVDLTVRILHLLRSGLVLDKDKTEARRINKLLMKTLSVDVPDRAWAGFRIAAINKSAEALFLPEIAIAMVEQAVKFHSSALSARFRDPVEFYRALNNLAAVQIGLAQYKDASQTCAKCNALISTFPDLQFPRLDLFLTNVNLAKYRSKEITAHEAMESQEEVLKLIDQKGDRFYPENHLAVYKALAGDLLGAQEILTKLSRQLILKEGFEANPRYFVESNLLLVSRFLGIPHAEFVDSWRQLKSTALEIPYETAETLIRRHELLEEKFHLINQLSPLEFDSVLLNESALKTSDSWFEIGHSFRLSDIQFWTY